MPEIFISYAHADDQPLAEGTKGWVTAFSDRLQKSLAMKSGGSGFTLWMDQRLEPQKQVKQALNERVGRADCFVAVLSPRYLESRWCRQEIEEFVRRMGRDAGRVFLVEIVPTPRAQWPSGTEELSPRQFWSQANDEPAPVTFGWPAPDPTADRPYWRALNELAHFISGQLESLARPVVVDNRAQRHVWIADPSDHVLDLWEQLGGALRQQGHAVLPQSPGHTRPSAKRIIARHSTPIGPRRRRGAAPRPAPRPAPPMERGPIQRSSGERHALRGRGAAAAVVGMEVS